MIEYYETTYDMESKKNADIEAILFGREDCAPSHGYGPTLRSYHLVHFVTKGYGTLHMNGEIFKLGPGDAFLIPAEQVSYYEASAHTPWSYHWVGFTGFRAERYVQQLLTVSPERGVFRDLSIERYAAQIDRAASLTRTDGETYFLSKAILYEILSLLASELQKKWSAKYTPALSSRIKFYLDAKYTEKLRMDELADLFGIHPNHMSRVFNEAYGIPPKQYLLNLKMKKAAQMLLSSDAPVALIGESLGFEDQHVFSRAFKKHWGVSPVQYRKKTESH